MSERKIKIIKKGEKVETPAKDTVSKETPVKPKSVKDIRETWVNELNQSKKDTFERLTIAFYGSLQTV